MLWAHKMKLLDRQSHMLHQVVITIPILLLVLSSNASTESHLRKANDFYSSGKLLEAVRQYKSAMNAGENPTLSYFNCANAYFQLDSLPQSIVYYRATVESAPDFFFRFYLRRQVCF